MPALRRATVSTRLTATEVSSIRLHSSWSPLSIARGKPSRNSAASRGAAPIQVVVLFLALVGVEGDAAAAVGGWIFCWM